MCSAAGGQSRSRLQAAGDASASGNGTSAAEAGGYQGALWRGQVVTEGGGFCGARTLKEKVRPRHLMAVTCKVLNAGVPLLAGKSLNG